MKKAVPSRIVAVDLFCGVGGKTHGFLKAGIEVAAGVDIDSTCRYGYEKNNAPARFVEKNVAELGPKEVETWYPEGCTKVLIGCAPCQPFSTYSYRYKPNQKKRGTDKRWELLTSFLDLVVKIKPDVVTAENVPELALQKHEIYNQFIEGLQSIGYFVDSQIVKCADYGIPQTRERLVVLASLLGPLKLQPPTHDSGSYVTVKNVIGNLPTIQAGGPAPTIDPLHRSCRLSSLNLRRIRSTPEGGGWQDWPQAIRLDCHKRDSGKTYPSVYGRMRWDALAPTLTTQCYGLGNGRFGHPDQDRAISLREAALLQTFPSSYEFVAANDRITFKNVGRHIGNAVPVRLGEVIAQSVMAHLRPEPVAYTPAKTCRIQSCPEHP